MANFAKNLQASLAQHSVPGAVSAVYHGGAIIETAHCGLSNLNTGVDVDSRTLFHIGSITKVINATLVMQAVDDGLLQLDHLVKRYLPDFYLADPSASEKITVKMLLNHTSGIDCDMFAQPEFDCDRVLDGYRSVLGASSVHAPGEAQGYCNGGSLIVGHLLQTIRGRGWYELVTERIFNALDLDDATAHPSQLLDFRFAKGHVTDAESGALKPSLRAFLPGGMAPAGSTVCMTAENLVLFAAMHLRDGVGVNGRRILSSDAAKQMRKVTARQSVGGFSSAYGLGWGLGIEGVVRHTGGGIGTVALLVADVASKTAIATLANADVGFSAISEFTGDYLKSELGVDPAGHIKQLPLKPELKIDPEPVTGRYASAVTWWELHCRNGRFELDGGPCQQGVPNFDAPAFRGVPLVPLDDHSFKADVTDASRLGALGLFLSMPVGVGGLDGNGRYQHFLAGARLYARVS